MPDPEKEARKHPHRYHPETVALRYEKKSADLLIRRAPFYRLIRGLPASYCTGKNPKFRIDALVALQETAKYHLVGLLDNAKLCAVHVKRVMQMS